jgi:hypothetical protein
MAECSDPQDDSPAEKLDETSGLDAGIEIAGSHGKSDADMWSAFQYAAADGWGMTTRLGVLMMARYGPHTAMAGLIIEALKTVGHHFGVI